MFCSKTCCDQYKTQKNILVLCEYCKGEKVHFDTISYNQQDVVFCSEREFTQKVYWCSTVQSTCKISCLLQWSMQKV